MAGQNPIKSEIVYLPFSTQLNWPFSSSVFTSILIGEVIPLSNFREQSLQMLYVWKANHNCRLEPPPTMI